MFIEAAANLPQELRDFPLPPASDRDVWAQLPADISARLLQRGAEVADTGWGQIRARDWLAYSRTGERNGFEALYFARRRRLNALVMATCAGGSTGDLDEIADGVLLICEESGWQLPAHNAYLRGGERLPLPAVDAPVVDLFAAETGAQLAVLAALIGPDLERQAPGILARIDHEITCRIIKPYLDRHFWWMGNGDEKMNNWTAWCTQNVLLAACVRPCPADIRRQVILRACAGLDAFLKDYAEDGACEEGPLYYRHAALCLWGALEILSTIAPDCFNHLWAEPKIRNMAEYIARVHVSDRYYINFGDSAAVLGRCGIREYLFGRAVGSDLLAGFAARDAALDEAPDLPDEINLWYRLLAATRTAEAQTATAAGPDGRDHWYPGTGLMIARDDTWVVAAAAGSNGSSHNHNDVGSCTVYRHGRPVLIDIGVETYSAKTFSARRYEIWTMQSSWHNLPDFDGMMQGDGPAFAARNVDVSFTEERARIAMELAGAWPAEARVRSFYREINLLRGDGVLIHDRYDSDRTATLNLMTEAQPRIREQVVQLGDLARITCDGATRISAEHVPISDARLRASWPTGLWRLRITAQPHLTLRID